MTIQIPSNAKKVIEALNGGGYEAFVVGGCVRDALLGNEPHDWDICTDALPEEMLRCFKPWHTIEVGIKHGTVAVELDRELYEVTAYRIDGEYSDNRHPDRVCFTRDLTQDLARRDFTVNAMAYNESCGLVDPFGGQADLKEGVIRCVGNPDERFSEDALRIMRALRFSSRFGFDIEPQTSESVLKNRFLLNNIAVERLQTELLGILTGEYAEKLLIEYRDVIAVLIPEISECFDFEQRNIHHCFDVYRHIARSVGEIAAEPLLRVAMLMHDIGKPRVMTQDKNGTRHFKGHQQVSADIAEGVLRRLRFPKAFTDDCLKLIMYHDVRFNGSKKQVKHVMSQVGAELMPKLFQVMEADLLAQSDYLREEKKSSVETAKKRFEEIIAQNDCFSLKELKINGNDLKTIGISEGRQIGSVLSILLDEVIDEQIENKKSALLKRAQQIIN